MFDKFNNDSKHKICEKMHYWVQSLPRRHIDIALQWKEIIWISSNVGEEELDGHTHILNSLV